MSRVQWNVRIVDTIGTTHLSFVERLSSFRGYFVQSVYTRVQMVCSLLEGLSSFSVLYRRFHCRSLEDYIKPCMLMLLFKCYIFLDQKWV